MYETTPFPIPQVENSKNREPLPEGAVEFTPFEWQSLCEYVSTTTYVDISTLQNFVNDASIRNDRPNLPMLNDQSASAAIETMQSIGLVDKLSNDVLGSGSAPRGEEPYSSVPEVYQFPAESMVFRGIKKVLGKNIAKQSNEYLQVTKGRLGGTSTAQAYAASVKQQSDIKKSNAEIYASNMQLRNWEKNRKWKVLYSDSDGIVITPRYPMASAQVRAETPWVPMSKKGRLNVSDRTEYNDESPDSDDENPVIEIHVDEDDTKSGTYTKSSRSQRRFDDRRSQPQQPQGPQDRQDSRASHSSRENDSSKPKKSSKQAPQSSSQRENAKTNNDQTKRTGSTTEREQQRVQPKDTFEAGLMYLMGEFTKKAPPAMSPASLASKYVEKFGLDRAALRAGLDANTARNKAMTQIMPTALKHFELMQKRGLIAQSYIPLDTANPENISGHPVTADLKKIQAELDMHRQYRK